MLNRHRGLMTVYTKFQKDWNSANRTRIAKVALAYQKICAKSRVCQPGSNQTRLDSDLHAGTVRLVFALANPAVFGLNRRRRRSAEIANTKLKVLPSKQMPGFVKSTKSTERQALL